MAKAVVIGSGFAGLSAACFLAKDGMEVTVLEKNSQPGGRARAFTKEGFLFDMGPSWYWMPDVFERFFNAFGTSSSQHYVLQRLDPSYRVFWDDDTVDLPASYAELRDLFESIEAGAATKLDAFLKEAAAKYDASMNNLVYKPSLSPKEFIRSDVLSALFRIDLFSSMHKHVRSYFKHPKLLQLTEFPILFLGALPKNTPALYSLMNYADMKLGTWYPMGGMHQVVKAMYTVALQQGVQFRFNEPVINIDSWGSEATWITTSEQSYNADNIVIACDYHHAEDKLLDGKARNYTEAWWDKRNMAPSSLLFYIGLSKKVDGLQHHNLFFDAPFDKHADELYTTPQWPTNPLMYVCCPSKTDDRVAPAGCENLFVLIPVAPGLQDDELTREHYFNLVIQRLENKLKTTLRDSIVYQRSYAHNDFISDYNAYKGNAYGLANTLMQTAFMKPSIRNKKLRNVFYTGQLTVPGPGVPPSLISGEIVAHEVCKQVNAQKPLSL